MSSRAWNFEDEQTRSQLVVDTAAATVVLSWAYKPGVPVAQFEPPAGRITWTLEAFLEQASPYHGQHSTSLGKRLVDPRVRLAVVKHIHRSMKRK